MDFDYFYPYYLLNEMKVDGAGNSYEGGNGNKSQRINLIHSHCMKIALLRTLLRGSEREEWAAYWSSREVSLHLLFLLHLLYAFKEIKNSVHLEKD